MFFNDCSGPNNGIFFGHNTVHEDRTHPHNNTVFQDDIVDDSAVTYDEVVPNDHLPVGVDDTIVLNIGSVSYLNCTQVTP